MKSATLLLAIGVYLARLHAAALDKKAPHGDDIEHVLIVTVDGLMPPDVSRSAEKRSAASLSMFDSMENFGTVVENLEPVFPAETYPSHTAIATGCNPATTGIVTNMAWDPLARNKSGWRWYAEDIRVPTLWDLANLRGLRSALIDWPVTVGARADMLLPDFWRANTLEDLKLLRVVSTPGLLKAASERVPAAEKDFFDPDRRDQITTGIAADLVEHQHPNLLMLQLIHVVYAKHRYGPGSAQAEAAIRDADQQVGRLVDAAKRAGTWDRTVLLVISEYGFKRVTHTIRPGVLIAKNSLITMDSKQRVKDWKAVLVSLDGSAFIYVKDPNDDTTNQKVLAIFQPLAGTPGSGIGRLATRQRITAGGGDPSAFLALEAADDFVIEDGYTGDYTETSTQDGTHGYFPDRPDAQGFLLAYGPSIEQERLHFGRLIDIAPTVARWLSFEMKEAQGSPLPIHLRAPRAAISDRMH